VKSIISMCGDVTSFSKDNINTRKDLAALCNRHSLKPKINAKGNLKRPRVPYCLKSLERKDILRWLKILSVMHNLLYTHTYSIFYRNDIQKS
jgi:hypothetical protein